MRTSTLYTIADTLSYLIRDWRALLPFATLAGIVVNCMLLIIHKLEIFKTIVKAIFVNVMNYFIVTKLASKMLFHDVSVLENSFSVNVYVSIPHLANPAIAGILGSSVLRKAIVIAKYFFSGSLRWTTLNCFTAIGTGNLNFRNTTQGTTAGHGACCNFYPLDMLGAAFKCLSAISTNSFHIDLHIKTLSTWLAGVLTEGTRDAKQKAQNTVYRYVYRLSICVPSVPVIITHDGVLREVLQETVS